MAANIGAFRVTLGVNTAVFEEGMRRAQATARRTGGSLSKAFAQMQRQSSASFSGMAVLINQQERQIRALENRMKQSTGAIGANLRQLAGVIAGAFGASEIMQMVDAYTQVQNQLRITGLEGEQLAEVQERLRIIANQYGTDLESLATVYGRISIAAGELGVTSEQVLQVNEAVAAALKVSGTSASQASGALLQLSQAMGSGVVRAEEFNSLLEGAFPLVQAAARGIERFGGSVAKLRSAIVEGEVSSREFFDGILAGSPELLVQAESATLTLAQSFVVLKNELTNYVGEASKTSGAATLMSDAVVGLSRNLEHLMTALSVIAVMMGGRWAAAQATALAAALRSSAATQASIIQQRAYSAAIAENAGMLNAHAVASARATAATTGLAGASRVAGMTLLSFFNPATAAVVALTAAIGFLTVKWRDAGDEAERTKKTYEDSKAELERLIVKLDAAGIKTSDLSRASDQAKSSIDGLSAAYRSAADEAANLAEQSGLAAIQIAQTRIIEAQAQRRAAQSALDGLLIRSESSEYVQGLRGRIATASAIEAANRAIIVGTARAARAGVNVSPERSTAAPASGDSKNDKGKTPQAAKNDRDAERIAADLRRAKIDELRAQSQLATTTEERFALEREILGLEREEALAQLAAEKGLNRQERQARVDFINRMYGGGTQVDENGDIIVTGGQGLQQQLINRAEREAIEEDRNRVARARFEEEETALQDQYDLARTQAARRDIAERLVNLAFDFERQELEKIRDNADLADAIREEARIRLEGIAARRAAAGERARLDTMSPMQVYLDSLPQTAEEVNERLEEVRANGIQGMIDGLAEVATGARSLGSVFRNMANQIIQDLIRIQLQRAISSGLNNAMGGVFGGLFGGGVDISAQTGAATSDMLSAFSKINVPGFRTGGSFKVGGRSGPDANLIAFRATAGEMVDISRPGQNERRGSIAQIIPSPYFDVVVDGRVQGGIAQAAPGIAAAGSYGAQTAMAASGRRRLR